MRVLDQETFFSELSKLYDQRKGSGSVWVSAKRTVKPIKWEKGVTVSQYLAHLASRGFERACG